MTAGQATNRYTVVSADCHGGASLQQYRAYLDPPYRPGFDLWAAGFEVPYEDLKGSDGARNWDSERRLCDLESDGIVGEVIYPNTVPPFHRTSPLAAMPGASGSEAELRWGGLRAHNRWLVDFCSLAKGRRAGIIHISLGDIEASVREIRAAAAAGMTGGILLPGAPPGSNLPPLSDHSYYEPLWAVCEETGFPVNCHSGGAAPAPPDTPVGHVLFLLEMSWWDQSVLRHLILGGVLERHPALQVVFTEAGVAWVQRELSTLDYFFDSMHRASGSAELSHGSQVVAALSCRPSEYWRRQCHVGASFMHRSDMTYVDQLGSETMMWGSDYPHVETSFPFSHEALASTFSEAPVEITQQIVGENALRLYRLDGTVLRERSAEVGPSRSAVHAGIELKDLPVAAARCPAFAGLIDSSGHLRWGDNRRPAEAPIEV
jgi:predicted TIM-barrel fold metal-dependent hydrolase